MSLLEIIILVPLLAAALIGAGLPAQADQPRRCAA